MRGVLLTPDGVAATVSVQQYEDRDGETGEFSMTELVEGHLEAIATPWTDIACYGNDEAKLIGMEPNPRATELLYGDEEQRAKQRAEVNRLAAEGVLIAVGNEDPNEPYIAGPVVFMGFDPTTGEDLDVPEALAKFLIDGGLPNEG